VLEQIHAQVSDRRHDRWRVAFANAARILRGYLGTHFRNSLTVGSLKKINNLFIKDIFHGYCLKRQSLSPVVVVPSRLAPFLGQAQ